VQPFGMCSPSHSRRALRPSFASTPRPLRKEGAGETGRRLAPMIPVQENAHATHRATKSEAGAARPPPRGGLTAYARSPWRRIPFASIASRINDDNVPVGPLAVSAKLDRSDDGQVHTVSQYASSAVRLARPAERSRGSAQSSARPAFHISRPTPSASTAYSPTFRDDARTAPFTG